MFRLFRFSVGSVSIGHYAFVFSTPGQIKGSASIAGTITRSGKPAKGIPVVAWQSAGNPTIKPPFISGTTDEEGRYLISGLADGKYQIAPYQPADSIPGRTMFDQGSKSVTLNENESATGVDFVLSAGSVITGRIVGYDGRPLIEQRITVENVANKQSLGGMAGGEMYRTDDRGIYRIYGLPAGRYY